MTNKTLELKIVELSTGLTPKPGHALVVMRDRDGGMRHYATVEPGDTFKQRSIFDSRKDLVGYHVNQSDRLRHAFSGAHPHGDGVHTFSLEIELSFRIESPEQVIGLLKSDPLQAVEKEAARVLKNGIKEIPWQELLSLQDVGRHVLALRETDDEDDIVTNMERLRRHAKGFGIELRRVDIKMHLSEEDMRTKRKAADLGRQQEMTALTLVELEDAQRIVEKKGQLAGKQAENEAIRDVRLTAVRTLSSRIQSIEEAIGRLTDNTHTMHDLRRVVYETREMIADLGALVPQLPGDRSDGNQTVLPTLPVADGSKTLPKSVLAVASDLAREAQELVDLTTALALEPGDKQALLGAGLHLVAEHQLIDGEKDLPSFHKRFEAELRRVAPDLPSSSIEALKKFAQRHV